MFITTQKRTITTLAALLAASALHAAAVGVPNTFEANTTAKASEVNDNFNALATGINNNFVAISSKQERVTGTCAVGEIISAINSDGSVVCAQTDWSNVTGIPADIADGDNDSTNVGIDFATIGTTSAFTDFPIVIPTDYTAGYLLSVTVTAPQAGYIHVNASFEHRVAHVAGISDTLTHFGITSSNTATSIYNTVIFTNTVGPSFRIVTLPNVSALSGTYRSSIHTSRVFYVSAPGTYTYYLAAERIDTNTGTNDISHATLSATFIPNRY